MIEAEPVLANRASVICSPGDHVHPGQQCVPIVVVSKDRDPHHGS